ncbi:hypothetical protein GCM10007962_29480 [Yeosuana aromativorans]|uniref:Uncharacterized protein n=1 Tax=Yeosuana aromativorans TaxID=288019 RepID=A0A8J3FIE2_9FLAO|nr:hypothetical protein [Yeosuana aromativorans]GGK33206.1 hypothetical protein GCM10007962_29480 [Yeosuana aromativorans]
MNKLFSSLIIAITLFTSCKKEQDPFQISAQHVGLLTDSTQVKDLKAIYSQDSLVNYEGDEFTGAINDIEIFEKGGKKLLSLSPRNASDSTSYIQSVRIFDPRFKTDNNISVASTFKDIANNYKITRIDNLINTVVVTVNELNASFTIDKKELPANMRFDRDLKIEATHIPDKAKIKYFFLNWNKSN